VWSNLAQVDEAVDRSQHMVGRHMPLEREFVKQSALIDLPLTHHHLHSSFVTGVNQQNNTIATSEFFNRIFRSADENVGANFANAVTRPTLAMSNSPAAAAPGRSLRFGSSPALLGAGRQRTGLEHPR
jgi:hypothetical protein